MKVLIVEDEPIVALDIRMMVEDIGHEVLDSCASVRAGMDVISRSRPDVAILDVRLTDGEVFPLADRLSSEGVKLVFHSGHVELDEILERYDGALFCPKPTTMNELQDCIVGIAGEGTQAQPTAH